MSLNDHGTLLNSAEVRFVRILPGPIERVWAFITDPEKRQLWLAGGTTATQTGDKFQLEFKNRELETPNETVPAKYQEYACTIASEAILTRHEPMSLHSFLWGGGEVIFELTPEGENVKLVLTHRKLPDHEQVLSVSGGWHIHLAVLISKLTGALQPPFWSTMEKLGNDYTATFDLSAMNPELGFCAALYLEAPATKVYEALTTSAGIQSWWTETCEIGTTEGGHSTFRFGDTSKTMRIERLVPATEVRWRCIDSSIDLEDGSISSEWIGTEFLFQLKPLSDQTTALHFQHIGLLPKLDCYSECFRGWTRFLSSLKQYVETGKGKPFKAES